jgi:hypothetical protein
MIHAAILSWVARCSVVLAHYPMVRRNNSIVRLDTSLTIAFVFAIVGE